jgi:hypothetical protein
MLVKGILSTASQLAQVARSGKAAAGAALAAGAGAAGLSPANGATSDAMRQVVSGYDVTDISPQGFSEMLQKLRQSGTLSDKDYQDLASIRTDLEQAGTAPDKHVNLVDLYTKKLLGVRAQAAATPPTAPQQAAAASTQRQLDWLQKFSQLRSGQSPTGVNAVA